MSSRRSVIDGRYHFSLMLVRSLLLQHLPKEGQLSKDLLSSAGDVERGMVVLSLAMDKLVTCLMIILLGRISQPSNQLMTSNIRRLKPMYMLLPREMWRHPRPLSQVLFYCLLTLHVSL